MGQDARDVAYGRLPPRVGVGSPLYSIERRDELTAVPAKNSLGKAVSDPSRE